VNCLRRPLVDVAYRSGALSLARKGAMAVDRRWGWCDRLPLLQRGAVVFMFHWITSPATPLHEGVSAAMFRALCELLTEGYDVVPLLDLNRRRRRLHRFA
jgi:hypothetical protein